MRAWYGRALCPVTTVGGTGFCWCMSTREGRLGPHGVDRSRTSAHHRVIGQSDGRPPPACTTSYPAFGFDWRLPWKPFETDAAVETGVSAVRAEVQKYRRR